MRSHSGEKLHWCRLPECDKVFSRADALNKHERSVHSDTAANGKAGLIKPETPASKKRKTSPAPQSDPAGLGAGDSDYSDMDEPSQKKIKDEDTSFMTPADDYSRGSVPMTGQPLDDPEVAAALASHPENEPDQIRCIVMLAKLNYVEQENARLNAERDAEVAILERLRNDKEELLGQICAKELS